MLPLDCYQLLLSSVNYCCCLHCCYSGVNFAAICLCSFKGCNWFIEIQRKQLIDAAFSISSVSMATPPLDACRDVCGLGRRHRHIRVRHGAGVVSKSDAAECRRSWWNPCSRRRRRWTPCSRPCRRTSGRRIMPPPPAVSSPQPPPLQLVEKTLGAAERQCRIK